MSMSLKGLIVSGDTRSENKRKNSVTKVTEPIGTFDGLTGGIVRPRVGYDSSGKGDWMWRYRASTPLRLAKQQRESMEQLSKGMLDSEPRRYCATVPRRR